MQTITEVHNYQCTFWYCTCTVLHSTIPNTVLIRYVTISTSNFKVKVYLILISKKNIWSKQDSLEAASLNTVRANPSGGTGSPQVNQSWDLEPPNI